MCRLLRPRSRIFRCLLMLAVVAWTAFAFEALAHPLIMGGQAGNMASSTPDQAMPPHCKGMTSTQTASATSPPAPSHPAEGGNGCCAFGHCDCASLCSGIVEVPSLAMTWPPTHDPALAPVHAAVLLAPVAPQLRPPIA